MALEWSLRRRIAGGLLAFTLLLTGVVLALGFTIHESSEQLIWRTLLNAELDHFLARRSEEPGYRWRDTGALALYAFERDAATTTVAPGRMAELRPGVHDEVRVGDREFVVLVRDIDRERLILALDIGALEAHEIRVAATVIAAALAAVAVLSLVVGWGAGQLVAPLRRLADQIAALAPDPCGQRLPDDPSSVRELEIIRAALNGHLQRTERFVERERRFIDTASHELRTPIAVIRGAAEIASSETAPAAARHAALLRILATTRDSENLIALLLALARDPARLRDHAETVALAELLAAIAADHHHLCEGKELRLRLDLDRAAQATAPAGLLRVAIGNLLRNAIENSDRGEIVIGVEHDCIRIDDPGHGMSAEEISRAYAQRRRDGSRDGIGLELIARLCDHLGWSLRFLPLSPQGTRAELRLDGAPVD